MKFQLTTPRAIVIASIILSLAIFFSGGRSVSVAPTSPQGGYPPTAYPEHAGEPEAPPGPQVALKADLDDDDFIYGNPDAEVFIIEYSDIDCPFCARVHPILEKVVDDSEGKIGWVFRHFPLTQIHPDAPRKARAAECVGRLAGNDSFWEYLTVLFNGGSTETYRDYDIDPDTFRECSESAEVYAAVDDDTRRATEKGGTGTPFSVVANDEIGVPVSGALPEEVWIQTVEALQS